MQATTTLHLRRPLWPRGLTRRQARAAADLRIAHRHDEIDQSLGWRVQELISPRERTRLAQSLRKVVKDLSPSRLPGASPVNRAALRPCAPLIGDLARRLDDLDRAVAPAGIVAVRRLLTDPGSPLYARSSETDGGIDVGGVLRDVRQRLEPR